MHYEEQPNVSPVPRRGGVEFSDNLFIIRHYAILWAVNLPPSCSSADPAHPLPSMDDMS